MLEAFLIVQLDVTDPERYEEYRRVVSPTVSRHDGTYLVRGGQFELFEGAAPGRLVIIRFPSFDAARTWYYSADYAAARDIRQAAARGNLSLVEGREVDLGLHLGAAPGFLLTMGTIHDDEGIKAYYPLARETVAAAGGRGLLGDSRRERLEGEALPESVVLLAFPGFQAGLDWYASPAYAEAMAIRRACVDTKMLLIAEGI